MKELPELNLPDDVRYAKSHEWAKSLAGAIRVGIDDYAQDRLGDIVFVELPQAGETFRRGDQFGTVESVKAVAEIFLPVGGKVTAVNSRLEAEPAVINQAPYEDGWMVEIDPDDPTEMDSAMDRATYLEMLRGLE